MPGPCAYGRPAAGFPRRRMPGILAGTMPIVDIEIVGDAPPPAQALADEAGRIFGSAPGTTWVRVRALAEEVRTLTHAVARAVARPPEHVHVLSEPAAAGRIAFGGALVE